MELDGIDAYVALNYQYKDAQWNFKAGFTFDSRQQKFIGTFPLYDFAIRPEHPHISDHESVTIKIPEFYAYGKRFISEKLVLGMGYRKNLPMTGIPGYHSAQINLNYHLTNKMTLIFGTGQYHRNYLGQESDGRSSGDLIRNQQISMDLKMESRRVQQQLSFYTKNGHSGNVSNKIYGLEYQLNARLSSRLKCLASFAFLDSKIKDGDNTYPSIYDLDYFLKGNIQYNLPGNWTISTIATIRQGTYIRQVLESQYRSEYDVFEPIYANQSDLERLSSYKIVDMSISKLIPLDEALTIIVFANASNIFNFKNSRARNYTADYASYTNALYSQRTFYFGAVFNF